MAVVDRGRGGDACSVRASRPMALGARRGGTLRAASVRAAVPDSAIRLGRHDLSRHGGLPPSDDPAPDRGVESRLGPAGGRNHGVARTRSLGNGASPRCVFSENGGRLFGRGLRVRPRSLRADGSIALVPLAGSLSYRHPDVPRLRAVGGRRGVRLRAADGRVADVRGSGAGLRILRAPVRDAGRGPAEAVRLACVGHLGRVDDESQAQRRSWRVRVLRGFRRGDDLEEPGRMEEAAHRVCGVRMRSGRALGARFMESPRNVVAGLRSSALSVQDH